MAKPTKSKPTAAPKADKPALPPEPEKPPPTNIVVKEGSEGLAVRRAPEKKN